MDERAVQGKKTAGTRGSTRSIAFVALTIALMGVSAWVAIPFGPVMLTLQMFALMFALLALTPRECLAAIAGYLALGAVGLNTDFKALCKSGAKPMLHGFIISLLVVLVAIGVEYMLGIAPTGNLF